MPGWLSGDVPCKQAEQSPVGSSPTPGSNFSCGGRASMHRSATPAQAGETPARTSNP